MQSGCVVCGAKLIYGKLESVRCHHCGKISQSEVLCEKGHFICDVCHQQKPLEFLEQYLKQTDLKDPVAMLEAIFAHPAFPLHGPEHHFLVPSVVLKSLENLGISLPVDYQKLIQQRSVPLPGGTCGHWGACAAALGAGITSSIFAKVTPLSTQFYGVIHEITARALNAIAYQGGPRCCKRNTLLPLESLLESFREFFHIDIPAKKFVCGYFKRNNECQLSRCPYFPRKGEAA